MSRYPLPWLDQATPFPHPEQAWPPESDAPGLLAAGGDLSVDRLLQAYRRGIFPWYSVGQPILWWSTDPRMVLTPTQFRIRRSFRKILRRFIDSTDCEIRIDHDFQRTIRYCASTPRDGQAGTWISEPMQEAYIALHDAGFVHSVETWVKDRLVGGLYCVAIGHAVFGESMFSLQTDASKIALAALVALCRSRGVAAIDCQQQTAHLQSMGALPVARIRFLEHVSTSCEQLALDWTWDALYWNALLAAGHQNNVRSE